MKLVLDEGIDRQVAEQLRQAGHEVTYIAEVLPSISDSDVLGLAFEESAVVLTSDKDFGHLVYFRRLPSAGVLLLRLPDQTPEERAQMTIEAISNHGPKLQGAFAVLSDVSLRIRSFPPTGTDS